VNGMFERFCHPPSSSFLISLFLLIYVLTLFDSFCWFFPKKDLGSVGSGRFKGFFPDGTFPFFSFCVFSFAPPVMGPFVLPNLG